MKKLYTLNILLLFVCLMSSSILYSQTNEWTWIKAGATYNQPGVYGQKSVVTETNKPGGRYDYAGWADTSSNLWLFGGYGSGASGEQGNLNDLWKYNTTSGRWVWIDGDSTTTQINNTHPSKSNKPGARAGCATWTDAEGNFWLFGGLRGNVFSGDQIYFNDLWKYNIDRKQWIWVGGDSSAINNHGVYGIKGQAAKQNSPGARNYAVTWTDASGNFWLFGGYGYAASGDIGYLNDLWKYNIYNNRWTWVKGDSVTNKDGIYGTRGKASNINNPGARMASTVWTDIEGNFWLFGGGAFGSTHSIYADLWKYNIQSNKWIWIKGDSVFNHIANNGLHGSVGIYGTKGVANKDNRPGSRYDACGWTDASGNLWLFAGRGYDVHRKLRHSGELNDLWKYNIQDSTWTWVTGFSVKDKKGLYGTQNVPSPNNTPGGRFGSVSWPKTANKFWVFGGLGYARTGNVTFDGYLNDLWSFTTDNSNPASTQSTDAIANTTLTNKINAALQPNPTTSSFTLNVKPVSTEDINIAIYNSTGRLIQQLKVQPNQLIHFGDKLPAGSYFVEVRQGKLTTKLTAIKQ